MTSEDKREYFKMKSFPQHPEMTPIEYLDQASNDFCTKVHYALINTKTTNRRLSFHWHTIIDAESSKQYPGKDAFIANIMELIDEQEHEGEVDCLIMDCYFSFLSQ